MSDNDPVDFASRAAPGRFSVREVIVEFLGSLVPGMTFILLAVAALMPPSVILLRTIERVTAPVQGLKETLPDVTLIYIMIFSLFLVLSYVAGHLFFRQDPKIPDERSFHRIEEKFRDEKLRDKGPARRESGERPDVQFPYRFLREFLQERGLEHLAQLVPWSGNDPDTHRFRTKHFVNALKIRLEFSVPDRYATLARNEAHVRLMSSMWFASQALTIVCLVGSGLALAAIILPSWPRRVFSPPPGFSVAMALPLVIFIAARVLVRSVERVLHYQRIREVVFVLETAYWANRQQPHPPFFEGLTPGDQAGPPVD